jgi:hypothetical protein
MGIPEERTLDSITRRANTLQQVRKSELDAGDWLQVTTRNSVYSIYVLDKGVYSISGGWVDQQGLSPLTTTINGCTWGGSVIKVDVAAACGLRLEFGKRVVTSTIQKVVVIRSSARTQIN